MTTTNLDTARTTLLAAVRAIAFDGWSVDVENGSGAWCVYRTLNGKHYAVMFATPWWEVEAGDENALPMHDAYETIRWAHDVAFPSMDAAMREPRAVARTFWNNILATFERFSAEHPVLDDEGAVVRFHVADEAPVPATDYVATLSLTREEADALVQALDNHALGCDATEDDDDAKTAALCRVLLARLEKTMK